MADQEAGIRSIALPISPDSSAITTRSAAKGPRAGAKGKSCDEYPFKTTYEGGVTLSKANRSWAWVPTSQQSSQGGRIKNFYYANRLLDHEAFWVKV